MEKGGIPISEAIGQLGGRLSGAHCFHAIMAHSRAPEMLLAARLLLPSGSHDRGLANACSEVWHSH